MRRAARVRALIVVVVVAAGAIAGAVSPYPRGIGWTLYRPGTATPLQDLAIAIQAIVDVAFGPVMAIGLAIVLWTLGAEGERRGRR